MNARLVELAVKNPGVAVTEDALVALDREPDRVSLWPTFGGLAEAGSALAVLTGFVVIANSAAMRFFRV